MANDTGDPDAVPDRDEIKDPHDGLFRRAFAQPANIASQLRSVLPEEVVDRLDLNRLLVVPGSFVDEEFQRLHTDLLLQVPVRTDNDAEVLVYVLVEHQSSVDPLMAYRMLRYVVRVWERHLGTGPQPLPLVIPLVVHAGRRQWTGPVELAELIDDQVVPAGWEFLPRFRFLLDDIAEMDLAALRARPLTGFARLVLLSLNRAPGNQELAAEMSTWHEDAAAVARAPGGVTDLVVLARYAVFVAETPFDQILEVIRRWGPQVEEAFMTTAEMLRAEGEARGRADLVLQLLKLRFGPLSAELVDRIHGAPIEQLEIWAARVLDADTLEQVVH